MTTQLEFNKAEVAKVEKDFSELRLPSQMRDLVAGGAQLYGQFIPLSQLALKGFIAMAQKDAQIKMKVDLANYLQFPKEQKLKINQVISDLLYDKLSKVLLRPEQRKQLKEAVAKGLEFGSKL